MPAWGLQVSGESACKGRRANVMKEAEKMGGGDVSYYIQCGIH